MLMTVAWDKYIYIYICVCVCVCVCVWVCVCCEFNKFPDFFVQSFKIIVDPWKFIMLLLYILWDDWPNFRISDSNEQLEQEIEYTLLKPELIGQMVRVRVTMLKF